MQLTFAPKVRLCRLSFAIVWCAALLPFLATPAAMAQRVLGLDVSAHQGSITTTEWATLKRPTNQQVGGVFGDGRDFVFIRSSRGGTTGEDHRQGGYPSGNNTFFNQSERYDDPYFIQNITRATAAGLFAGAYHFARPDVIVGTVNSDGSTVTVANTGTDEANHFIQMAGPWMRPGYLPPMYDFEAGQSQRTATQLAQFSLDFSNRIYQVMGIRPSIYINGTYNDTLSSAPASLRSQLAQPAPNSPSVVSPAYPTLVTARWPNQANPGAIDVQNAHPKDTYTPIYGPWDDYGTAHPWDFWQYSSTMKLNGNNNSTSNTDVDVAQGDIEWLKDRLIPAVWMNDSSGDWSTLINWNSGQAPVQPPQMSGQLTPFATGPLPAARLPGAAGSGPTAGSNDTVILERPNANITVTLASGTHNIRKMYMREALNITGGTLTINYDPNYISDTVNYPNALRSGPISAQFSGPVSLGGSGSLNVNTLQIDASQTFTLAGSSGALTFKQINLLASAKIAVTGDISINPLSNAAATISGSSGSVDLNGGTRIFNIGDGAASVDLDVAAPMVNGGLIKNGAGTMRLSGANTFAGPVTVNAGVLRLNNAAGFANSTALTVNSGGTLDMNGISDTVASLAGSGGAITQGAAGLTLAGISGTTTFAGVITGTGTLAKTGGATQILSGNNTLGPVSLTAGTLLFNGSNATGMVTVNGGTLGGIGAVSGAVIANSGAHLAPGASIGTFGMGALTLNAGSVLDIDLGAPGTSDLMNITGTLTLNGGSVNLLDAGGLGAGTYTLATYASEVGDVSSLGTPVGPGNFNYQLIASSNLLTLLVTIPGDFDLNGTVNGSDYVYWHRNDGTQANYDLWRANYGRAAGSGSGSGSSIGITSIPEPATAGLIVGGLVFLMAAALRRRR
jgi:autotransporter-associated beta strand protein